MTKEQTIKEKTAVPEKFKEIVEKVESMSVLDLSELVKVLEERFGVSAAAMVAAASVAESGGAVDGPAEEKTLFAVELKNSGAQKIQVIKIIREALGLGLKEAKDLADGAPKVLREGITKAEAEELKKKLEAAGAVAELK